MTLNHLNYLNQTQIKKIYGLIKLSILFNKNCLD